MATSLYEATVPGFIQIMGAVHGLMARTLKHCSEANINLTELLDTRLIEDMQPLRFQLRSVVKNSVTAIEDAKQGAFSMPRDLPSRDFAGYQDEIAEAGRKLAAYSREEINALEGGNVAFTPPGVSSAFTAEDYLLSFATPNFYFHAATAYDILRMKGVPLGKRDFLGAVRSKS